jgi:uracil phosphoribosyltransferase
MAMESSTSPPNTTLVTSPAFHEALSQLRDRSLPSPKVRALVTTMSTIIAAQATASLPADSTIALIVILRAGLAMSSPFLDTVEANTTVDGAEGAKVVVYHLGLFRDKKTLEPVEYYNKLPVKHAKITHAFVVDPLIATGGSIMASIAILKYAFLERAEKCSQTSHFTNS